LFSISTGWPHIAESRCPIARATTSVTPPAAAVTKTVTGRVGQVGAFVCAWLAVVASRQPSTIGKIRPFIIIDPFQQAYGRNSLPSCPALCPASTSWPHHKTWMAGASPAMTTHV
jgi:hypothetical protein